MKQGTENDPILSNQVVNLGCLLVCIVGNFLAPVLVAAYAVNNLDLDSKAESYEIY